MSMQRSRRSLQIRDWILDPTDDSLTRGDTTVKLEPRLTRLLECLAEANGDVVTQDQLNKRVWTGLAVTPASLYQSISQLRKALGDTEPEPTYIETVPRKGYRLKPLPEATLAESTPSEPALSTQSIAPAQSIVDDPGPPSVAAAPGSRAWRMPLLLGLGVLLVLGAWLTGQLLLRPAPALVADSIVVLPFVDMTPGQAEQPFCDGLTEELSNWLAQIPTLRVVARTSAFSFHGKPMDVREIGRTLGTTHVLEGSLRRSGDTVRVTVQLIATHDGYHLWSGSYDFAFTDIIEVQEEIARAVAGNLELQLTSATAGHFADRRSGDAQAYRLYLIARHHQQRRTKKSNDRAIELYRESIAADPEFALAHIGLAYAYMNQRYFDDRAIRDIERDVTPLLDRAAALAPELADLYVVRGALRTELLQREAALADLSHAMSLNANSRQAASELGFFHLTAGKPREALRYFTQAVNLDPLDFDPHGKRCLALVDLGQLDAAAAACQRARSLRPDAEWIYSASSDLEESRGRLDQALKWNATALKRSPEVAEHHAARGRWLLRLGLIDAARTSYDAALATGVGVERSNLSVAWLGLMTSYARGGLAALNQHIEASGLRSSADAATLFELANMQLMAGDLRAARSFVDRALLASQRDSVDLADAWDARSGRSYLLISAVILRATGNPEAAEPHLNSLTALLRALLDAGMQRHGIYLLQSQAAALQGDVALAMSALNRAAELGWRHVWLAEHEPYFQGLRTRADFRALLAKVEARNLADQRKLGPSVPSSPKH